MRGLTKAITVTCAAVTLTVGAAVGAPAEELANLNVSGNEMKGTKDCAGGNASISGNDNTLTLKNCKRVSVFGNSNKLTLVAAQALEVSGNKNFVEAGQVRTISTMGNKNTVFYKVGPGKKRPRISNLGSGNKISAR